MADFFPQTIAQIYLTYKKKKPSQNQKFEAVFLFLLFWKNVIEKIFSDFFEPLPFF